MYDYPVISIKLKENEVTKFNGKYRASYNLKLREWKWYSEFNEKNELIVLACKDANGNGRYKYDKKNK